MYKVIGRNTARALMTSRETREEWLTVETEVNGDSKSTNERVTPLVASLGSSVFMPVQETFILP